MSLRDVEKNLYEKEEGEQKSPKESSWRPNPKKLPGEDLFRSADFLDARGGQDPVRIKEDEGKKEKRRKLKKTAIVAASVVVGLFALYFAVRLIGNGIFSGDRVKVDVSSPEKVQSGDTVTFTIDYQNLNAVSLREAIIHVTYPENFKPEGNLGFESDGPNAQRYIVGAVPGKSGGKIPFQGKFFGPKDLLTYVNVKMEYKSFNYSSAFATEDKAAVFIASSPLFVEMSGPQDASPGNTVDYLVKYRNDGGVTFRNLKVKADYPADFSYAGADPLPVIGNNVWYVGDLGPGESGEIKISGNIGGRNDEIKRFKAGIGEFQENGSFVSYGDSESSLKIIGPPFEVAQTVNGKSDSLIVNAGDNLQFIVTFRNASTIGMKDVILTEELKSPILDLSRINMSDSKAYVDFEKSTITWKAAENPVLKTLNPGQGGQFSFSVPVKDVIPVSGSNDKNFAVNAVARISSPDVPTAAGANKTISGNTVAIRLNSKVGISIEAYYNDPDIRNTGPTPLKVGAETTFAVHLKVMNVSNDLTGSRVVGSLASGVSWKGVTIPQKANVSFNSRTNEFAWDIGALPAGIGVITGPRELVFQVGVTPGENQVGGFAPLTGKTVFSGKDSFTGETLQASVGGKDTNLPEDMGIGNSGGMVTR